MNSRLAPMLVVAGVVTLGGVSYILTTPQPATRTMAELRDAGIADGQRFVLTCPERLTPRTKRRIRDAQGASALRPKQNYARIARVAVCFNPDAGNCFRPSDMLPRVSDMEGTVIVPSLRRDAVGLDPDAGEDADGGEDAVDDSWQFDTTSCSATQCASFDAGDGSNFCGRLNRIRLVDPPCAIPNGWRADGGWCEEECGVVDCRFSGPYGELDGGPRWRGFNVGPREYSSGTACVPVECGVVSGDVPEQWL